MSERHDDDEILGRALSRAIETQDAQETPYERSRLAVRPLRRGLPVWQMLGAAAVLVLAVAFGAWFTRPTNTPVVATSPSPTSAVASPTNAVKSTPSPSPSGSVESLYVYYTRDSLPPIGDYRSVTVAGPRAEDRILARLAGLHDFAPPQGVNDPLAEVGKVSTSTQASNAYGVAAKVDGDLATIVFDLPNGWGVKGASMAQQLVQQIVYTATEENGIKRVEIAENGKTTATIDQLRIDKPLTRDDVSGYKALAQTGTTEFAGSTKLPNVTGDVVSRDIVDGTLVRYTFVGSDRAHNAAKADLPPFSVSLFPNDRTGNDPRPPAYVLTIAFHVNAQGEFGAVGHVEYVDRSPLRRVTSSDAMYVLGLDDARPWRAYEPDPQHLVVEVGGDPRTVSDRIAVSSPIAGSTVQRTLGLAGLARTFEANVVWRVRDASGKVVANDHTTASIGTSALWGTFSTQVTVPSSVSGNVTLEVYEVSPKDGSEQGVVSVPLVVR